MEEVVQIDGVELTTEGEKTSTKDGAKAKWENVKRLTINGVLKTKEESYKLTKMYGGEDGVLDDLEITMIKYDTDHNGTFDISEVKSILFDMDKKTKEANSLRKKLHLVVLASVIVISLLLGLMLGANEVTKENHTKGGNLVDKNGGSVKIQQVRSVANLLEYTKLDYEVLKEVKDVSFQLEVGKQDIFMKVAGFERENDGTAITLHGYNQGVSLVITSSTVTYKVTGVGDRVVNTKAARRRRQRRLIQMNSNGRNEERLLFNSEAELVESFEESDDDDGMKGNDRKLSFQGALMTSGSFTMMASSTLN